MHLALKILGGAVALIALAAVLVLVGARFADGPLEIVGRSTRDQLFKEKGIDGESLVAECNLIRIDLKTAGQFAG